MTNHQTHHCTRCAGVVANDDTNAVVVTVRSPIMPMVDMAIMCCKCANALSTFLHPELAHDDDYMALVRALEHITATDEEKS